jgi:fructose-bisphosphate aldolase class I
VDNTETNRRDWREVLYTADGLGNYISGCIMFEETLYQSTADGVPFVKILKDAGILPGIKVDTGLQVSITFSLPLSPEGESSWQ